MDSENPAVQLHRAQEALAVLAAQDGTSTPFSTAAWIAAFQPSHEHSSLIALDIRHGGQRLILPLVLQKSWGITRATPPGGALANYHGPVLSVASQALGNTNLAASLRAGLAEAGVDCLMITDCPVDIRGVVNPLAGLAHQPSPDGVHRLPLRHDSESLLAELFDKDARKKQRQKARKRLDIGAPRAVFLDAGPERDEVLAQLLQWKRARFASLGIVNPFASIEVQAALKHGLANGSLRCFGLFAGERVLAGLIGAMHQGTFSGMLNAHDPTPEIEKTSPGEALLIELIGALCAEDASWFDLGTGEARYKSGICPEFVPLFDLALGVSLRGKFAARAFLMKRFLKGRIKASAKAMAWIAMARRLKARLF